MTLNSSLPLVIVNPASADGATGENWPKMASDLRTHFGPFSVVFTEAIGDGRRLAADAAQSGTKLIVACGGDGTISEVANGIIDSQSEAELGIVPSGTGGDFRRTLQIAANTREAAATLRNAKGRHIDAGRAIFVNDAGERETRFFVNVASFGMSTAVLEKQRSGVSKKWFPSLGSRRIGSKLSYAAAAVQTSLAATVSEIYLQLDNEAERRLRVAELAVANARYYGGAMKIAPEAKIDDGLFDVVTIGDASAFRILSNAPRLYFGAHLSMNEVSQHRAKQVVARPQRKDQQIAVELDGEIVGRLPVTFEVVSRALRVRY